MPTNDLYHTWMQQICELRPNQRITQVRNFVWLMIGLVIYIAYSRHRSEFASVPDRYLSEPFGYLEQDCRQDPWFGEAGEHQQTVEPLSG